MIDPDYISEPEPYTRFVQVESQGSFWFFDQEEMTYVRSPKNEGPRPPGPYGQDWGGPTAGKLQDLKSHDYTQAWLDPIDNSLHILYEGAVFGINTPPDAIIKSGVFKVYIEEENII